MIRRLTLLVVLIALVVSACAGATDDASSVSSADADTGTTESADSSTDAAEPSRSDSADASSEADTDAEAASGDETVMAASSPLGAFFADDGGFQAALAEYTTRVEESIVRCMAAQGFEFAPNAANTNNPVQDRQNDLTIREWTTQYGFGISTSFDSVTQNLASNPNFEIFVGMSPAEQEVWALTLNGVGVSALLGGDGPVNNTLPLEEQGCIGQALIETGGQEAIEGLGDFGEIYEEGEAALFERRELVDAVDAWTRCMSEGGFPNFGTLDDPEDEIRERFQVITEPLAAQADLTDEEGQALLDGDTLDIDGIASLDIEALRDVQADEIELALADLDCYEAEVQAIFEPLRDDFENGLLSDFATEFDALRNIGS